MKGVTDIIDVVARVLISAIFLKAAYAKITGFSGTADYMKSNMPFDNDIVVSLLLVGAIILLTVGGISVLIGYKVQAGALLLIIFLVPTTYFFHNFINDPSQTNAFMKNMALIGALLFVMAHGTKSISLQFKMKKSKK